MIAAAAQVMSEPVTSEPDLAVRVRRHLEALPDADRRRWVRRLARLSILHYEFDGVPTEKERLSGAAVREALRLHPELADAANEAFEKLAADLAPRRHAPAPPAFPADPGRAERRMEGWLRKRGGIPAEGSHETLVAASFFAASIGIPETMFVAAVLRHRDDLPVQELTRLYRSAQAKA